MATTKADRIKSTTKKPKVWYMVQTCKFRGMLKHSSLLNTVTVCPVVGSEPQAPNIPNTDKTVAVNAWIIPKMY